jgi:hypothetical protein
MAAIQVRHTIAGSVRAVHVGLAALSVEPDGELNQYRDRIVSEPASNDNDPMWLEKAA